MERLRLHEVLVVEGKYDAAALESQVDALIITTEGYGIFSDEEKKELLRRLGCQRGLIILTDSDAAGFEIRHYINKIVGNCRVLHAYIPAVAGKEKRKQAPSKEGTLGVEGMPPAVLRQALCQALETAQVKPAAARQGREIGYTELYELGLSGGEDSAIRRRELLARIGLPQHLSKKALCGVLSSLYTYEELVRVMDEKPVLFWDFHGTLSLPDITWFDVAMEAAAEAVPQRPLDRDRLVGHFTRSCLPWWTIESGDTRHLCGSKAWWAYTEEQFVNLFQKCGFSYYEAQKTAPLIRGKVLEPERYQLYPDALPTLRELQRRGYESYMLSNNYPELESITNALGLQPYLKAVFVSGQIGYEKPRGDIFRYAAEQAGKPRQMWMMGDSVTSDIDGAKATGFTTVLLHKEEPSNADYCLANIADVLNYLP